MTGRHDRARQRRSAEKRVKSGGGDGAAKSKIYAGWRRGWLNIITAKISSASQTLSSKYQQPMKRSCDSNTELFGLKMLKCETYSFAAA